MNQQTGIAATVLLGLLLYMVSQSAGAIPVPYDPNNPGDPNATPGDPLPSRATLDQKIAAFLATIRRFEAGGDNYDVVYSYAFSITDFSHHPADPAYSNHWHGVLITMGAFKGQYSTAAGAYQINWPTWKDFAPRVGVTDFTPASQDAVAAAILQSTGAIDALAVDNMELAFSKASRRWASLPGSTAGQGPQTLANAISFFDSLLTLVG